MKYDMQFLYALIVIGLVAKKMTFREWFFTCLFVIAFILFNAREAGKLAFGILFLGFFVTLMTLYLMRLRQESLHHE